MLLLDSFMCDRGATVKSYFELELKTNNSSRSPFSCCAWFLCFSCYAWFLWEHDWNCWSRNLQCLHWSCCHREPLVWRGKAESQVSLFAGQLHMNECNRWHFAHVGAPWKYSKCSRQSWYDMTWWTLYKCIAKELLVMAWALPPQTRFKGESVASELFKFLLDTVWMSRWCFTDLVEEACGNVSVSRLWCWSVKVQPGANHAVWWYTSILFIHASTVTPQIALWCLSLHLLL